MVSNLCSFFYILLQFQVLSFLIDFVHHEAHEFLERQEDPVEVSDSRLTRKLQLKSCSSQYQSQYSRERVRAIHSSAHHLWKAKILVSLLLTFYDQIRKFYSENSISQYIQVSNVKE